jgi:hypothetical protein
MTDTAVETAATLPPMFNTRDRCDRCGVQAKLRALFSGGTLLFCGHHGRELIPLLEAAGAAIESEF